MVVLEYFGKQQLVTDLFQVLNPDLFDEQQQTDITLHSNDQLVVLEFPSPEYFEVVHNRNSLH